MHRFPDTRHLKPKILIVLYWYDKRSNQPCINNCQRQEHKRWIKEVLGQPIAVKHYNRQDRGRYTQHGGNQQGREINTADGEFFWNEVHGNLLITLTNI